MAEQLSSPRSLFETRLLVMSAKIDAALKCHLTSTRKCDSNLVAEKSNRFSATNFNNGFGPCEFHKNNGYIATNFEIF